MVDSMVNTADALNLLGRPLENADIRLNRKMNAEKIGLKALKLPKIENPRCKRLNLPDVGTLGHILVALLMLARDSKEDSRVNIRLKMDDAALEIRWCTKGKGKVNRCIIK